MEFSKKIIQTIEILQQEIINSNKSKIQSNIKPEREISNPTTGTRIL
jgi:hypothetical protein